MYARDKRPTRFSRASSSPDDYRNDIKMFKTYFKRHFRIVISVGISLFSFSLRSTHFLEIESEFKALQMLMHGSYRQPVLCYQKLIRS